MKKLFTAALLVLLLSTTHTRAAEEYGWRFAQTTVDVLVARPFTFAATLLGGVVWTISLPISVPTKTSGEAFDALVRHPYDLTFSRGLGDYGEN